MNEFFKVKKRNGNEVLVASEEEAMKVASSHCVIYFKCSSCGGEGHKEKRKFNDNYMLCKSCSLSNAAKKNSQKANETKIKKYGSLSSIMDKTTSKAINKSFNNLYFIDFEPLFALSEFDGKKKKKYPFICKNCCSVSNHWIKDGVRPVCQRCKDHSSSNGEKEIQEFLEKEFPGEFSKTKIDNYEIDCYSASKKVGVEYDGLYWHSEDIKGKNYHYDKMTFMRDKHGIKIINVFEDEWQEKRDIVKSIIKSQLGKYDRKIFARKCELKEIKDCSEFLNENHIQGNTGASVKIGLFYDNELVSVMTFGKSRFNKKYSWELIRLATKLGTNVIGGASKMFSYFMKKYGDGGLISYCDARFFNGTVYTKLGMKELEYSRPNYFYVKNGKRFSRVMFQKHKLEKILPVFDASLSEVENMKNNKYFRIFDCGNKVFAIDK